jgi:iron(III) transport system permease protein
MNWLLLQNSLLVAGLTTALAVGFGLMAALWLATLPARWRNVFLAIAIAALALPPFLVTNCWISLLGETGAWRQRLPLNIYSLGGTIWILSLMLWPITLFAVVSAWRRLEAAQFECEPALTGFALLRWLLIPVAKGELALAAVVTFVLALNNFAVPAILQTRVLPDEMWVRFNTQFDALGALKLSVPLIIAPIVMLLWISRRGIAWPRIQGSVPAHVFKRHLGATTSIGCGVMAGLLGVLSVGFPLAQIAVARRTWTELPGAIEASTSVIWSSFWFAALAATAVVGGALVFCSRRRQEAETKRAPQVRLLTSAATVIHWLPFFIPGVLMGIALIWVFNRPGLSAFYQSAGIVLLALGIRYFALGWTAARHAVASVDHDLTDAAKLEGATRWQLLRFVTWPQIAPQIFAAWYVVYLLCLWDVESIVIVQPPGTETLALKIFNLLHYGYAAQVNALCVALLGLAVLPLLIVAAFVRTRRFLSTWRPGEVSRALTSAATVMAVTLLSGCSPPDSKTEATMRSKFFERVITVGSRGVGIGEFNKPRSVACDADGNVFAVDMTGRVQKFSPDGKFLLTWQMPQTELGNAKGMGRDHAGNIIVIEPHYQRVNHYAPDGTLVAQWGCRGTNDGCFILPRAVAVNSRGELLITEYMGSERVQRFGLGTHSETPNIQHPTANIHSSPLTPALSPSEGERENVTWPYSKSDASRTAQPSQSTEHAGPEASAPRSAVDLLHVIGRAGTGPSEFNRPEGICVDALDRIYVADSCNHRIQIFSPDGKFIRQYGRAGSGLGELSYPYDIAVDTRGYQYVCEFGNSRIQVFDADCQPVEIIGGPGAAPGQFANPWAVALDGQENLWVADGINHRLQKLVRRTGRIVLTRPIELRADAIESRTTHHAPR